MFVNLIGSPPFPFVSSPLVGYFGPWEDVKFPPLSYLFLFLFRFDSFRIVLFCFSSFFLFGYRYLFFFFVLTKLGFVVLYVGFC